MNEAQVEIPQPDQNALLELRLPVWAFRVVMAHLGRGTFDDVSGIICSLAAQATPQLQALDQAAAAKIKFPTLAEVMRH